MKEERSISLCSHIFLFYVPFNLLQHDGGEYREMIRGVIFSIRIGQNAELLHDNEVVHEKKIDFSICHIV